MATRTGRIVIEVSEEARTRFKIIAARRRMTMRALLDEVAERMECAHEEILAKGPDATIEKIRNVEPEAAEIVEAGREAIEDMRAGRLITLEEFDAHMKEVLKNLKAEQLDWPAE